LVALVAWARPGSAEPRTLAFATAAPDGTSWARELRAIARDVEQQTQGSVRMKWYFGGIAGSELDVLGRIRRGQLDGAVSTITCPRLAPSLLVTRIPGLFRTRAEVRATLGVLRPTSQAEFSKNGFVSLVDGVVGPVIILSRVPVRTFDELKKLRMWRWDLDDGLEVARAVGLDILATPVEQAARAYDEHRVDAFAALPGAALAFQWSTQARYFSDLVIDYLPVCFFMSRDSFEALEPEIRGVVRGAAAKAEAHLELAFVNEDELLVNRLFAQQGLKRVPVSEELRAGFFEAAERALARVASRLVPSALLEQVTSFLTEYRRQQLR
jgi:TRAP-type C4-dicarboxylate transport system substrate-binding protein